MASSISVMPATMARVGVDDDRYVSYNVEVAPTTITFLAAPTAGNSACR
jgi:hypothetical protein